MTTQKNSSDNSNATRTKETVNQAVDQAKERVGQVADKAQQQAKSQLAEGKDQVADRVDDVAGALRRTGEQLQEGQNGAVGEYVNKAAEKISEFSQHLRANDINQLVRETENFARREPAIFLGGAFALGILAARFMKSSAQRRHEDSNDNGSSSFYGRTEYERTESNGMGASPYRRTNSNVNSGMNASTAYGSDADFDQPA